MKLPNHKFQNPNNIKIPKSKLSDSNVWNLGFGICLEFDNWNLELNPERGSHA